MAFGIASGVTPQAGLYTAVVAGFLISALGGSRLQIGGPTGAFVVIVAGIIATHGVSGLLIVTLMAGVILMLMAVTGLGTAVKYIPRPVTIGFTNGIAILIASTQIKDFLGLETGALPSEFVLRMSVLTKSLSSFHWSALVVSIGSLLIIFILPRLTSRIPGSIVALVIVTLVVAVFGIPVETIGSRFGGIPTGLPHISIHSFDPI
jgi:SulP family sulfate permease